MKNIWEKILIFLKGTLMGACDVVPGVSGGTIAFITGIYDKLIDSLYNFNLKTLKLILKGKFKEAWKAVNGGFLVTLFLGILVAILTLAKLISFLLSNYPSYLWAFFFGLIIASVIILIKSLKNGFKWSYLCWLFFGIIIGFALTSLPTLNLGTGNLALFFSGAIAIMAMILPGVSGSYILVLLGQYQNIIGYVEDLTSRNRGAIVPLIVFILGCIVGLILFSKLLHWIKENRHDQMVVVLTGFIIGSLQKVWPWKETIETYLDIHGKEQPLIQNNILPSRSNDVLWCILLAVVGLLVVLSIEFFGKKFNGK